MTNDTYLMEVIRTTELKGEGVKGSPYHRHIQYYTKDGKLLFEDCESGYCNEPSRVIKVNDSTKQELGKLREQFENAIENAIDLEVRDD